jgi:Bacterial surface proteins containing Ig-like domains
MYGMQEKNVEKGRYVRVTFEFGEKNWVFVDEIEVIGRDVSEEPEEPVDPVEPIEPVEPADPIEPPSEPEEPVETEWVVVDDITIKGTGHIQGLSIDKDNDGVYKDKVFTLGTIGESRRLEGFTLDIEGSGVPSDMMLVYRAHVQTYGDMPSPKDVTNHIWRDNMGNPWNKGGTYLGTKAERKRVEGIELRLIDKKNKKEYEGYKIQYQVHMQGYGWGIDDLENDFRDNGKIDDSFDKWVANGEFAGTRGQSRRIEAIRIRILREQSVK